MLIIKINITSILLEPNDIDLNKKYIRITHYALQPKKI